MKLGPNVNNRPETGVKQAKILKLRPLTNLSYKDYALSEMTGSFHSISTYSPKPLNPLAVSMYFIVDVFQQAVCQDLYVSYR